MNLSNRRKKAASAVLYGFLAVSAILLPNALFSLPGVGSIEPGAFYRTNQTAAAAHSRLSRRVLHVPSEFSSIAKAVKQANDGDWVIIAPGTYHEKNIKIDRAITVSSTWKLTEDKSKIKETILDAQDDNLFTITADGVEISGLHIVNGDHALNILSKVSIVHNHFVNNKDALSFESSGGGYAAYNLIENDRDDGIDVDIGSDKNNIGSDITIAYNTIVNSNDDGMEIRLFSEPNQNIHYEIRGNEIVGSGNAGIQLISYDTFTGKEFNIHHNTFRGCKTGLGCMEGSRTREDLTGAGKMDERVLFYNNTIVNNQMGATGGNYIVAVNNIVSGNTLGGFKRFGNRSAIINNCFFGNGGDDFIDIQDDVAKAGNVFSRDPLLDETTLIPQAASPCIDAGKQAFVFKGVALITIPHEYIAGTAPDIGALEFNGNRRAGYDHPLVIVDAGDDIVLKYPQHETMLKGTVSGSLTDGYNVSWRLDPEVDKRKPDILNFEKPETPVRFTKQGIYKFAFLVTQKDKVTADYKTVRYVQDGEGSISFLDRTPVTIVEAENYAYAYGTVAVAESSDDKYVSAGADDHQSAMIEYSIGTSSTADITIWLRIRNAQPERSSLLVTFNNKSLPPITPGNSQEWKWIACEAVKVTAGQWPLLIEVEKRTVWVDKILFSFDARFNPAKTKR